MDSDFAYPIECVEHSENRELIYQHIERWFKDNYVFPRWVLDIGERNPLTARLEAITECPVTNTWGDLDTEEWAPEGEKWMKFEYVLMSHVIEHLFNPFGCLQRIKKFVYPGSIILIATPIMAEEIKLKPSKRHFHEFDDYRLTKLIQRAGFVVTERIYHRDTHGGWYGIRPIIRRFTQKNGLYICRLEEK